MTFENSAEQYRPSEVHQISTAALLPSNTDYQNFFRSTPLTTSEPAFVDFRQEDIYGEKPVKLAQDVPLPLMPTLVPSSEQLGITKPVIEATAEASKVMAERAWNPYRYSIDDTMREIPEQSWKQAYEQFPQFKQAGLSEKQATEVMKAIVRNELYNYDAVDRSCDEAFQKGEKPLIANFRDENKLTLGFSQLSTKGVHERETEYPSKIDFHGHERDALLEPQNAPLLVAATLAHNIEMYRRHHVPITEEILAYSYNALGQPILPTAHDLQNSIHTHNVMHQLQIIRGQSEPTASER